MKLVAFNKARFFFRLTQLCLGMVFVFAAIPKLRPAVSSGDTIVDSVLNNSAARYSVLAAEWILGIWLCIGRWAQTSAICSLVLLSSFSGLLIAEMQREQPRPCGCFGASATVETPEAIRHSLMLGLARNGAMIAAAAVVFLNASRPKSATGDQALATIHSPEVNAATPA